VTGLILTGLTYMYEDPGSRASFLFPDLCRTLSAFAAGPYPPLPDFYRISNIWLKKRKI